MIVTQDRVEILRAIQNGCTNAISIGEHINKPSYTVSKLLFVMKKAGLIESAKYGYYRIAQDNIETVETKNEFEVINARLQGELNFAEQEIAELKRENQELKIMIKELKNPTTQQKTPKQKRMADKETYLKIRKDNESLTLVELAQKMFDLNILNRNGKCYTISTLHRWAKTN